jgi:hypothetical protein
MSVADLISVLNAIQNSDEIEQTENVLNYGYIEDRHSLIQQAVALADQLLLTDDGRRNYTNETELVDRGFQVYCLERDSCGWLVGGIETSKGTIAYG